MLTIMIVYKIETCNPYEITITPVDDMSEFSPKVAASVDIKTVVNVTTLPQSPDPIKSENISEIPVILVLILHVVAICGSLICVLCILLCVVMQ